MAGPDHGRDMQRLSTSDPPSEGRLATRNMERPSDGFTNSSHGLPAFVLDRVLTVLRGQVQNDNGSLTANWFQTGGWADAARASSSMSQDLQHLLLPPTSRVPCCMGPSTIRPADGMTVDSRSATARNSNIACFAAALQSSTYPLIIPGYGFLQKQLSHGVRFDE